MQNFPRKPFLPMMLSNLFLDTIPKKADNRNEISQLASWDELLTTINYNTTIPTTHITTSHTKLWAGPSPDPG